MNTRADGLREAAEICREYGTSITVEEAILARASAASAEDQRESAAKEAEAPCPGGSPLEQSDSRPNAAPQGIDDYHPSLDYVPSSEINRLNAKIDEQMNIVRMATDALRPAPDAERFADLKAKEAVLMDIHAALGIKWGDDPYTVIAALREGKAS